MSENQALTLLRETYELIWEQDAPHVFGGAEKLDDLAIRIGRFLGVDEEDLTGPGDDEDAFLAYAQDMSACVDCPHSDGCPWPSGCEKAACGV